MLLDESEDVAEVFCEHQEFVKNLPEEYQWLLDALVLAGCSEEQARQWLDRVRETGLENRFTVPRSEGRPISLMNP